MGSLIPAIEELQGRSDAGADVNARDQHGDTALMWATNGWSPIETVRVLLDAGADLNARTESGSTALIWAAKLGTAEILKVLLVAGADASAKNADGETAWELAQDNEQLKGTDAYWMLNDARFE